MDDIFDPLEEKFQGNARITQAENLLIELSKREVFSLLRNSGNQKSLDFIHAMNRCFLDNDEYPISEKQLAWLESIKKQAKDAGLL